jgi:hypothetical protein
MNSQGEGSSPPHELELLEETIGETNALDPEIRREVAKLVVRLASDPYVGELMDDRPPKILRGCRKIRFDLEDWDEKPRFRIVYRNEPEDGAVGKVCVLAVGQRAEMMAYARAATRLKARIAEEGRS